VSDADRRFTLQWDAVDPFDRDYPHLWVKIEHLGRYLFAARFLSQLGANRVGDIGCGTGYGSYELSQVATEVVAVDVEWPPQTALDSYFDDLTVSFRPARLGDGLLLQIVDDRPFDGVVCYETLEHLTDPFRGLCELGEVLSPEGTLILSVPNGVFESTDRGGLLTNKNHRRMFSISSISALLIDAGFVIRDVLGQPLATEIAQNEARLLRQNLTGGRIGDDSALHEPENLRRLARAVAYPEPRDVERSYSIIVVAARSKQAM
jgi:2-polyprenyl-3-methyl-5-hydroxy-6-metoxy-1,4-benzoquinol methylase